MKRYNYHEIKNMSEIPAEANSEAVKTIGEGFKILKGFENFDTRIRNSKPKRHGKFNIIDSKGRVLCYGEFHKGVIKKYHLVKYDNEEISFPCRLIETTEVWNLSVTFQNKQKEA